MIHLGMHTDNWRTLSGSFEQAVDCARRNDLEYIEFGVIDGQNFIQGLGYDPAISLEDSPMRIKKILDKNGLKVSQIDRTRPAKQRHGFLEEGPRRRHVAPGLKNNVALNCEGRPQNPRISGIPGKSDAFLESGKRRASIAQKQSHVSQHRH